MKVRISYTIDVDADAFAKTYDMTKREAIDAIKELAESAGKEELIQNGFIAAPGKHHD